ncbi:MAG: glutathione S-transferase family protein [Pseudomonadota bacterium]
MILIGQYDSPFVRRAAIALHHHGVAFERRVLSTFAHFDDVAEVNPLSKVPVLVLPDGHALPDSGAIVQYLDLQAPADQRLLPEGETARDVLTIEAIGVGLAEKTYERGIEVNRRAPGTQDPAWMARLEAQITSALRWLERRARADWFVGNRLSRADLAVTVAVTYATEKLPHLFDSNRWPKLSAFRERAEGTEPFCVAPYSAQEARATGWRPESEIL